MLTEDDALPDGSVDLNAENVHAFYNAAAADAVTLSLLAAVHTANGTPLSGVAAALASDPMSYWVRGGRVAPSAAHGSRRRERARVAAVARRVVRAGELARHRARRVTEGKEIDLSTQSVPPAEGSLGA